MFSKLQLLTYVSFAEFYKYAESAGANFYFFFAGCSEMNWRGQECLTLIKRLGEDFRIGSETMSVQFT
jgi:hypothetical protein